MILTVIFLITCVITARIFDQRKMKAAAVAYSVVFIVVLSVLAFTVDYPLISRAMSNIFGINNYNEIHSAICETIQTPVYGFSMIGGIAALFFVQLTASVLEMARAVVSCFKKEYLVRKFRKAYVSFAQHAHRLILPRRINLLYCRMLN